MVTCAHKDGGIVHTTGGWRKLALWYGSMVMVMVVFKTSMGNTSTAKQYQIQIRKHMPPQFQISEACLPNSAAYL
jgi:hypothetical protein